MSQDYEIHDLDRKIRFSLPRCIHGEFFLGRYVFNEDKSGFETIDVHDINEVRKDSYESFEAGMVDFWNSPRSNTVKDPETTEWVKLTCRKIWDFLRVAGTVEVMSDHQPWPDERYDWPDLDGEPDR